MEALEDKRVRLQPECKKRLNDRIEMWSYAAKVREALFLCVCQEWCVCVYVKDWDLGRCENEGRIIRVCRDWRIFWWHSLIQWMVIASEQPP